MTQEEEEEALSDGEESERERDKKRGVLEARLLPCTRAAGRVARAFLSLVSLSLSLCLSFAAALLLHGKMSERMSEAESESMRAGKLVHVVHV